MTLREYILDRRIEEAKRLLSNGENVSEACCKSGFSNYSNFIRSFTKLVGISPGKYMRLSKAM
ncbi:helix-turn-helix transcriptional regulator [Ruminiclostridium josui]|uniref:helix-turn-helix domain-containing protein n=1 Tax=Ruminiclostridium josui TaxID=1499 RepID=UPI000AD1AA42